MRHLILADIHANLPALDAVLDAARAQRFESALVLGDLVGYGAQPNEVIDRVLAIPDVTVIRGNHDKVAAGLGDSEGFNPIARHGAQWTQDALTEAHAAFLRALPLGPAVVSDWIEICHGTPHDEDTYVLDAVDALEALRSAKHPLCLFAHTHVPAAYALLDEELSYLEPEANGCLKVTPDATFLVNVGSVGQPRDGDSRAAFGIVDDEARKIWFFRVTYDVAAAQAAIRTAGLPEMLAARLARGQ